MLKVKSVLRHLIYLTFISHSSYYNYQDVTIDCDYICNNLA